MARRLRRLNRVICVALLATAAALGCQNAPGQSNRIDVAGAKLPGDFGGSDPGTLVSANLLQNLGAPLSNQTDQAGVSEMQRTGAAPSKGTMVSVDIPDDASGF